MRIWPSWDKIRFQLHEAPTWPCSHDYHMNVCVCVCMDLWVMSPLHFHYATLQISNPSQPIFFLDNLDSCQLALRKH